MEAARPLPGRPPRRPDSAARELERLRPLGEAFLLRRFGARVSRADAEDAVAEVVIRLHHRIEAGQAPRNLRAAFFASVRNAAIDQLRARAARPTTSLEAVADAPAEETAPPERAVARENALRLQEALGRMRANYREAIALRFGLGLTVPEIAERLQISLPAAKKLVLRSTEQARRRLQAIEGQEFCPDVQDLARRSLAEKELAGIATEQERGLLRSHLSHCGHCRSFLAELRHGLHELGASALLAGAGGSQLGHHLGILDQLGRWLGHATETAQVATTKLRLAAFRASGGFGPGDASSAGALTGTAQKALAICGAGAATTATCLATGVIGPGLGAGIASPPPAQGHSAPPPIVKTVSEAPTAEAPAPPPEPSPAPAPSGESSTPSQPQPGSAPSQPPPEEFGFESSSAPSESAARPEPAPAPGPSSPPSSGGGAGGGAGGEKFGFGG